MALVGFVDKRQTENKLSIGRESEEGIINGGLQEQNHEAQTPVLAIMIP